MTILETRFRPPYNLFAASVFFCWLFGSISLDLFREPERDMTQLALFCIFTLISLHLLVRSLRSLVFFSRTGLKVTDTEIIYSEPGFFRVVETKIPKEEILEINRSEGSILVRHSEGNLILRSKNFLLGEESILHALRKDASPLSPGETESLLMKFTGVKCSSCGAGLRIDMNAEEELSCDYCNDKNSVPRETASAIGQLKEIVQSIPEIVRQLSEKGNGKIILTGNKSAKGMRIAAIVTLGVWLLFGAVEFISSSLRENTEISYRFIGIAVALGVFTLISALFLSFLLKKIMGRLSADYRAVPLPEGKASCRLCGGVLPESGVIRRCSWCATDNIADPDAVEEYKKETGISLEKLRNRFFRRVSDTEKLVTITSDQLILITATQFLWLHIPVLVLLDGSPGMATKITPLFVLFTIGAFIFFLKGFRELKKENR